MPRRDGRGASILLFCDDNPSHADTILQHIGAFKRWSRHTVRTFNPRGLKDSKHLDLEEFDAVAFSLAFGWTGLFYGYFLSTALLWHGTFSINIGGETMTGDATRLSPGSSQGQASAAGGRGSYLRCNYSMNNSSQGSAHLGVYV